VNHWKARTLLASLPDGTLPARTERALRLHAMHCGRCRVRLAEILEAEALLAQLPVSLVPLEPSRAAHARLAALARWAPEPRPSLAARLAPALGTLAAAAAVALLLSAPLATPTVETRSDPVTLAAVLPDSRLFPTGVR
jgi:anti-sigma factor RsiW